MKAALHTETIAVDALRVGMHVHLDVGWMSHPFPLSSFRIASAAQLATIRTLGLHHVRWSPQLSDSSALAGEAAGSAEAANDSALDDDAADDAPAGDGAEGSSGPDTTPGVLPDALEAAARERELHRLRLAEQAEALARCQRQYGEAAKACRHTIELVEGKPREAKAQAEALTDALLAKMLGERDLCIRMLTEGAADKASMHAMNVAIVSLLMGRCLGLPDEEMHDLGVGAMLHDVGKLDLPARIRFRDDSFSPSEVRVYEEHVELGMVQARRMGLSPGASAVIAQHHEHADGSGFPEHLNSDRMTTAARIVSLVNTYDNLCNPRLLAKAHTPHEALSLLFAQGRSRFDAPILGAFIKMMSVYPPGSTVQLTDDRYAQVVSVNASRPLKPDVLVYDPRLPREEALILDLESAPGVGIRRSLKPQALPPPALDWLAPAPRVCYFFEPAMPVDAEPALSAGAG